MQQEIQKILKNSIKNKFDIEISEDLKLSTPPK
jgi:hypothetical protein